MSTSNEVLINEVRITAVEATTVATTVAWEPCTEFHDDTDAVDGCCAGCGWAPDDHDARLATAA